MIKFIVDIDHYKVVFERVLCPRVHFKIISVDGYENHQ